MNNKSIENSKNSVLVRKASGEEEPFKISKLETSLRNAGAAKSVINEIINEIKNKIYHGITTKRIYVHAFSLLRKKKTVAALRYKLKQAIFELGPTGYPFEHFIGKIFEKQGYVTEIGQTVEGFCISHEMDVIANKNNQQILVECKYHKDQGKQVSIQVPLYVRSRVDDIIKKRKDLSEYRGFSFKGWVATNTRFSLDSIKYAKCNDLHLLAWDYPAGNGLKDIIGKEQIFPITILHSLTRKEKQHLMSQGIVICSQLLHNTGILNELRLNKNKLKKLLTEVNDICE